MTEVYLLQNNDGLFLNKQQEWVDGSDASSLYRSAHKDDAINTKVELTVKAPHLRISTVVCSVTERGVPCLPQNEPNEPAEEEHQQ